MQSDGGGERQQTRGPAKGAWLACPMGPRCPRLCREGDASTSSNMRPYHLHTYTPPTRPGGRACDPRGLGGSSAPSPLARITHSPSPNAPRLSWGGGVGAEAAMRHHRRTGPGALQRLATAASPHRAPCPPVGGAADAAGLGMPGSECMCVCLFVCLCVCLCLCVCEIGRAHV